MRANKTLAGWLCGAALAMVQTCAPAVPVLAQVHPRTAIVAVGDTAAPSNDVATAGALHDAITRELPLTSNIRLATGHDARWVVRGAVTQLSRDTVADGLEVHCAVSLVVADARGGAVRVLLHGRASARGDDGDALTDLALSAAVRSALRPLGGALGAL